MANNYYQKHKERIKKEQRNQNLPEEKKTKGKKRPEKDTKISLRRKIKKLQYHCEHNKNLFEEPK